MKVGIMSMHRIYNYGSVMQAYGLKKIIESMGHTVVFVDYNIEPSIKFRENKNAKLKSNIRNFKKKFLNNEIWNFIFSKITHRIDKRIKVFSSFYPYLKITNSYKTNRKVDILIIGSDEVFNCLQDGSNVGFSQELFGKNSKTKKIISYAASFGSTTISEIKKYGIEEMLKDNLLKFDSISVRDKNSESIIKHLCGMCPERHLDPVLISWIENEKWHDVEEDNFIILYGYYHRFTKIECQVIHEFAKAVNKKLIALGEEQYNCDLCIMCRPDEVISYFKKASFVVTDTFHGTIFSVICKKKFCTKIRNSVNGTGGNSEKITDLLERFNLTDHSISDFSVLNEYYEKEIDYDHVQYIRKLEEKRTFDYLKQNLLL